MPTNDTTLKIDSPYYKLKYLFGLLGLNALTFQVILFREMFVTFSGNELSWGIFFATWLLSGALGSYTYTLLNIKLTNKVKKIFYLFLLQGFIFFIEIIIVRIIKTKLGFLPTEILKIEDTLFVTVMLVALPSFIFGLIFSMIIDFTSDFLSTEKQRIAGMLYSFEALGSFVAAILLNFFLLEYFTSLQIALSLITLNLIYGYFLLQEDYIFSNEPFYIIKRKRLKRMILLTIASTIFLIIIAKFSVLKAISEASYKVQWKGINVTKMVDSKYGKIAVSELNGQYNIYQNSRLSFIFPDPEGAERRIHLVMSHHKAPKSVLIFGGMTDMMFGRPTDELKALYKYSLDNITIVELDPLLKPAVSENEEYLSYESSLYLKESNVHSVYADIREFIKSNKEKYDVILLNSGEPDTLFSNRYFTKEFYDEIRNSLNKDGIFSFSVSSSPNYLSGAMYHMQSSIYKTLSEVFDNIKIISSDSATFIASESRMLKTDNVSIYERFHKRELNNTYFTELELLDLISNEKNEKRMELLKNEKLAMLNTDFNPKTYMLNIMLQGEAADSYLTKIFEWFYVEKNKRAILIGPIVALILFVTFFTIKSDTCPNMETCFTLFTSGFVSISLEILLLFIYQILFGYVYYKIGLLLGIFMLGLFVGSYFGNVLLPARFKKNAMAALLVLEALFSLYIFTASRYLLRGDLTFLSNQSGLFYMLIFVPAFITGLQFPIANAKMLKLSSAINESEQIFKVGGRLYASELFGACIGSLILTLILIPFYGVATVFMILLVTKVISFCFTSLRIIWKR
ncbi:fused MFS/spermidine synthase [Thermodesulfobacteriota bacterium]